MRILLIFLTVFLALNIALLLFIIILQIIYNIRDKIEEIKLENYEEILVNYAMSDDITAKKLEKSKKYKFYFSEKENKIFYFFKGTPEKELILKLIDSIGSFEGEYRRRLIFLAEELDIIDYLFGKYKSATLKVMKELTFYQLGELRSTQALDRFLKNDLKKIEKSSLLLSYAYGLITIVDEWVYEIDDKVLKEYINRISLVISIVNKNRSWSMNKIIEYLLEGTNKFFNYMIENKEIKIYFLDRIVGLNIRVDTARLHLQNKGEIIYIFSLKKEYEIIKIIKREFRKYMFKEDIKAQEREYLIKLVKAAGELGIEDSYEILEKALKSEDWVLRSIAVKYIAEFPDTLDVVYQSLFDNNWWVRYNSAKSILNYGEEGIASLINSLRGKDKYAREISAYVLSKGFYLRRVKEIIKKGFLLSIIKEINLLVTKGNSIGILNSILLDSDISETYKVELVKNLDGKNLEKYYKELIKEGSVGENIMIELEQKIEEVVE